MSYNNYNQYTNVPPPPLPPRSPATSPPVPPRPAAYASQVSLKVKPYNPQEYSQAPNRSMDDLATNLGQLDVNSGSGQSPSPNNPQPTQFQPPPAIPFDTKPGYPGIRQQEPPQDVNSHQILDGNRYSVVPEAENPMMSHIPPQQPPRPQQQLPHHQQPPRIPQYQQPPPPPPPRQVPQNPQYQQPNHEVPQVPSYQESPIPEVEARRPSSQNAVNQPPLEVVVPISQLIVKQNSSRDFLRSCPRPEPLSFSTRWYYPSCASKFTICSNCYKTTIQSSRSCPLSFESFISTAGVKTICNFSSPRVKSLWKSAGESNDWRELENFMKHRAGIATCHGVGGTDGTTNTKWFYPESQELGGFVCCQACYEDEVLATNFTKNFKENPVVQPADQTWACDVAVKNINRALQYFSARNDWQGFVKTASHRLKLPGCSRYKAVPRESTKWYQPKGPLPYFVVCEPCYLDLIANSSMEVHFQPKPIAEVQQAEAWICTMGYWGMSVAFEEAVFNQNNFRLWFECARLFINYNLCDGKPVKDASWYRIKEGEHDFDICPSCYTCAVEIFGFAEYFVKTEFPAGTERSCDFFPARHGFVKYTEALSEAVMTNRFEVFRSFVKDFEGIQPCLRSEPAVGRNFYGNADFSCCAECYREVIQGSKLELRVTVRNQYHERAVCHMYSPRMRKLWAEACETDNYDGFAAFARHRSNVYLQTVPVCKQILSQQRIALMQQQMHNTTSSFYRFMDGRASVSGINYTGYSTPTYTYTAPDVSGTFSSQWGIDAARYEQKANAVAFNSMSNTAKVGYLEAMWEEVE